MIGPLVIAGVSITHKKIKELDLMGIKDSKKLTPHVREKLYKQIIDFVDDYYVTQINPFTIDRNVRKHQLNALEAKYMAKVILKLSPDISYVDSCDVNATRFGKEISGLTNNGKIRSYHHADSRFVIVSAASILAKVTRDKAIKRLQLGCKNPKLSARRKPLGSTCCNTNHKKSEPETTRRSTLPDFASR